MKVCIDAKILFENGLISDYSRYQLDAFRMIEKEIPQVEFCFLTGKMPENGDAYPKKSQFLTGKALPGMTGWKIWNNLQIPAMVKRAGASILIKPGGVYSPKSLPQVVWLPGKRNYFNDKKLSSWLGRELETTIKKASVIVTDAERNAQYLREKFPNGDKILVFPPINKGTEMVLTGEEKEKLRKEFAEGKEFFFLDIGPNCEVEIKPILQGFSQFKKMQKSNMQLVIGGLSNAGYKEVNDLLEGFRFRQDVHVLPENSNQRIREIQKGAYALLLPEASTFTLARAYASKVPVIENANAKDQPINKDPAPLTDFANSNLLGEQLMKIYKNESYRDQLIREGNNLQILHMQQADIKVFWKKITDLLIASPIV
ncbi:MAG: hypothetical protein C5B59_09765 [Bacteroidetes bacterium]|nr:MAG: hypothetical protein C5B59_09765 [Bacteroidota bacterium]